MGRFMNRWNTQQAINNSDQYPLAIQTGRVTGVGETEEGFPCLLLMAEGRRIEIPYYEAITLPANLEDEGHSLARRYLSKMIGAEIDYIITEDRVHIARASRKAAMRVRQQQEMLGRGEKGFILKNGQIVDARVIVVMKDTAILEVAGVETVVPKEQFSWRSVRNLYHLLKTGMTIPVKLIELSAHSITVSPREAIPSAFDTYSQMFPEGTRCVGTVTGIIPYRYFVTLQPELVCLCKLHDDLVDHPPAMDGQVQIIITVQDAENKRLYGTIISVK